MPIKQLSAIELKSKIQEKEHLFLLDVREPFEFTHAHIDGSVLIPLNQIPQRLREIDMEQEVVLICHHGMRSMQAANFLAQVGFRNISNLVGGIDAWSIEVDSAVARY
ncbi:rhodanese-like domain-containing protein [Methyloglobulus sp.]|uniref:rhodanese-like domain-containing protein n=1 Tax=Methyloglobulus sp. TaxID=2518622 RepID=UPI0032B758FD